VYVCLLASWTSFLMCVTTQMFVAKTCGINMKTLIFCFYKVPVVVTIAFPSASEDPEIFSTGTL